MKNIILHYKYIKFNLFKYITIIIINTNMSIIDNLNIEHNNVVPNIVNNKNMINNKIEKLNENDSNNIIEKKNIKVKNLLSTINSIKLNNEQYIEIYKIIKMDNNIKIMTNKNGVFIDLQYLDKLILDKLELFIHYITTNELSQNIV